MVVILFSIKYHYPAYYLQNILIMSYRFHLINKKNTQIRVHDSLILI